MSDDVVLASWTDHPYTSYDKRSIKVHHRVRVIHYERGRADVLHERCEGSGDWETIEAVELRDGMYYQKLRDGVLEE